MNPEDHRTSCPGFLDEYGVWNNGFDCPPLAGQIKICCGSESRRYCCSLESRHKTYSNPINRLEKNSYSTINTSLFITQTKSSTILALPILFTCILTLVLIFLFVLLSLFFWYRYRTRNDERKREKTISTKTNLLADHFQFSPPHHSFIHDNNSHYTNTVSRLHQQTKDTLTTTTTAPSTTTSTSSTSGRISSDIYFNDWKDFLTAAEQPMNMYPTLSSHSNELANNHVYPHSNYLYHGKRQQHDVIV